jgi:hypothetical protein
MTGRAGVRRSNVYGASSPVSTTAIGKWSTTSDLIRELKLFAMKAAFN